MKTDMTKTRANKEKDTEKITELTVEELEKVNGGTYILIPYTYPTEDSVVYKWNIGDHVERISQFTFFYVFTEGCTIIDRKAVKVEGNSGYCACYRISSSNKNVDNKWFDECLFEHGYKDWDLSIPL